jgi:uncharacterized metal-binding protein
MIETRQEEMEEEAQRNASFSLEVTGTTTVCAAGELFGRTCQKEKKIPVFSCEGGCIKGEIARLTANLVARGDQYARACHGELFTVPRSDLAKWVKEAEKVVVIDGCGIRCHGRIAENVIERDKLLNINALAIHGKFADLMDVDDVPEEERKQIATEVSDKILAGLEDGTSYDSESQPSCGRE